MRTLSIDIETYSSVDLTKSGVYKYVEAPDFEVLIISYHFDNEPETEVFCPALPTPLDLPKDLADALTDPNVVKHAWNANFERTCLSKYFGEPMPPEQWRCTMIQAARYGLPLSLDACAKVLGVAEKDKRGKELIRYFSIPCKPTKTNGGRTRNLPQHDPDKWEKFKAYCKQDVVVEREIADKVRFYPTSEFETSLWELDQRINDAGIKVDPVLIENAIRMDQTYRQRLEMEAIKLTGLSNPNSAVQLKEWLGAEMGEEVESLKKDHLPILLDKAPTDTVERVIEIRRLMSKTSVKKYQAMQNAMCADERVRGLLQFYGANRTGRWAGRLVQVQNLPSNTLKELDLARNFVREGDLDTLELLFDSVPDTLSQLIRTAFVGPFTISDFSAIEARVIAWLAGEQWRIDVFNSHGKIYEASASQMFDVPLEKVDKELRKKGKIAELALGYQGGVNALVAMGALKMGLAEDELQPIVDAWRAANPKIVRLWNDMQRAAIQAMREPGKEVSCGYVKFVFKTHLGMILPSGRWLVYWKAHLRPGKYGDGIVYYGMDQVTKQWGKVSTYGGKLVENATQAIARDILAVSMMRLFEAGYDIAMHVHDEVVVSGGEAKVVSEIMGRPIDWAKGLPLKAEAYGSEYYRKD